LDGNDAQEGRHHLQVILRKRATNYRSFWREITYKHKARYASSPPCIRILCDTYCIICCISASMSLYHMNTVYAVTLCVACRVNGCDTQLIHVCDIHSVRTHIKRRSRNSLYRATFLRFFEFYLIIHSLYFFGCMHASRGILFHHAGGSLLIIFLQT